ncbi:MAG: hypothetical protein LUC87_05695 [Clostridiales bacterium]|nr:hypothetical protein [Clostridiales bacterium]MCD8367944.1 hypothetical protein [Clostridiales bacterium]
MKFGEIGCFLTDTAKISRFLIFSDKAEDFPGSGWGWNEKIHREILADRAVENKFSPSPPSRRSIFRAKG